MPTLRVAFPTRLRIAESETIYQAACNGYSLFTSYTTPCCSLRQRLLSCLDLVSGSAMFHDHAEDNIPNSQLPAHNRTRMSSMFQIIKYKSKGNDMRNHPYSRRALFRAVVVDPPLPAPPPVPWTFVPPATPVNLGNPLYEFPVGAREAVGATIFVASSFDTRRTG